MKCINAWQKSQLKTRQKDGNPLMPPVYVCMYAWYITLLTLVCNHDLYEHERIEWRLVWHTGYSPAMFAVSKWVEVFKPNSRIMSFVLRVIWTTISDVNGHDRGNFSEPTPINSFCSPWHNDDAWPLNRSNVCSNFLNNTLFNWHSRLTCKEKEFPFLIVCRVIIS